MSLSKKEAEDIKKFFLKLKRKNPKDLDTNVRLLHDSFFESFDCLTCAKCCSELGPRLTWVDIERISRYLKIRASAFTTRYLRIDEDNDYVFKAMPCPFLMPDNYCSVYEARPKSCREYPHTDHRHFVKLLDLSFKNLAICQAVKAIVDDLKIMYNDL